MISKVAGTYIFYWWNSPTTIVTKLELVWLLMKHCMEGGIEHRFVGIKLGKESYKVLS